MRRYFYLALPLMALALASCTKYEGPGGSSSIVGKIHHMVYDGANNLINEYDAPKHDVYIIYGNNAADTYFDDDIETSFDGTFRFDNLEKGNYRIFTYEKCPTCPSGDSTLFFDVEITEKRQEIDLGTINVRD